MHPAYRLLGWVLLPALVGWVAIQARKAGGRRFFRQRLGWHFSSLNGPIWFHCASVGEVRTACPLIRRVLAARPGRPVLVTTNTATGAEIVSATFGNRVAHAFLPLDLASAVDRLLDAVDPACLLICETEIWPMLYERCTKRRIPLMLFNARLSARTLEAPGPVRWLYRTALERVSGVLARSERDARGFAQLGANEARIRVLGNLKFSACQAPENGDSGDPIGRPYWLAASTHDDEELRLDRIWNAVGDRELLAVIAPRHPDRGAAILEALTGKGRRVARRSRGDPIESDTDLYLADTLGELPRLIRHARFVFVGGSLVPVGGHNVLEPARCGKAILTGPHTEDFREEVTVLASAGGLIQVRDDHALEQAIRELVADPQRCESLGASALAATRRQEGIADDYLDALIEAGVLGEATGAGKG